MIPERPPLDYWREVVLERRAALRRALGIDLFGRIWSLIPADATAETHARVLRDALQFWAIHGRSYNYTEHADELIEACRKALEG